MKTLTKKQRREIYLKVAEKMQRENDWWGLCFALQEHIDKDAKPNTDNLIELFPEFGLFRPDKPYSGEGGAWWYNGLDDAAFYSRLDCMLLCAEMCKD